MLKIRHPPNRPCDLNVKYVLEGSIRSMGDQIRVTVQLIEAASGSQVWSERLRSACQ